jgi:Ribosome biogenesis protein Nop16
MFAAVLSASYAALGLVVSLNPNTSGGAECAASVTEARRVANEAAFIGDPAVLTSGGSNRDLPIGLGRIVRDEAGRITAVETNDDVDPTPPDRDHRLDLVEAVTAIRTPESQSWLSFGRTSDAEKPITELIRRECGMLIASGDNRFDLTFHGIIFAAVSMNCFIKRCLTSFVRPYRDSLPKGK